MKPILVKIFAGIVGLVLITQISLIMKSPTPAEFKDPSNVTFALISNDKKFDELGHQLVAKPITGTDGIAVFFSVAVAKFGESGFEVKDRQSEGVKSDDLFSADSMTKMITSAAILRMTEEEKYQEFLPDGVETKLSAILPLLKKHYPHSTYIQKELEAQPNFGEITLRHLAQHTSGLARVKSDAFRNSKKKLTPEEMIDAEKKPKTGEYGEQIGEYFYNDLAYELLGRVVVAVDAEQGRQKRKFGNVVDDLVISRVREKIGAEQAADLKFFTSDQMEIQMEIVGGETKAIGHPELSVKFGKDYHDGEYQETPSHFYDMTCGGSYTNPRSMSRIAFHVLHSDLQFSIFKKPETLEIFNSQPVAIPELDEDGKFKKLSVRTYGFGYESHSQATQFRTHGGLGYGSNSNALVDTAENKVAVIMVGFENLTLPLAYALINEEKAAGAIRLTPELYQKSLELSKNYSESQLVEMRQGLEKSYDDFREKFDAIQKRRVDALDLQYPKKPSPSPEKSYAEKMSQVKGSKFNEI